MSSNVQALDEGNGRFVQIDVNSSFASGVTALVFDVLLLMVIKVVAQSVCATANLYLVYDKRTSISPSTSRLGYVTEGPVGPRNLSRILSLLIVISTACVIVLGFSINGKTVRTYGKVSYSSVIQVTGEAADYNFDEEFKVQPASRQSDPPTHFISRRLAALADSYVCLEHNSSHGFVYAYAYQEDSLEGDMVNYKEQISNSVCVKNPLFKDPIVSRSYELEPPGDPVLCSAKTITPSFREGEASGTADFTMDRCDFEVSEMFCFRTDRIACATMANGKKPDQAFVMLIPDPDRGDDTRIVDVPRARNAEEGRKIALTVAFLNAIGVGGYEVSNLANIATSRILRNVTLERETGFTEVSEVDLLIFIPVAVIVAVTTIILTVVAVVGWIQIVYRKGRRRYNTFSSLPEALQLANKTGKERFRGSWRQLPRIGIATRAPRIAVRAHNKRDDCAGADWAEERVDK